MSGPDRSADSIHGIFGRLKRASCDVLNGLVCVCEREMLTPEILSDSWSPNLARSTYSRGIKKKEGDCLSQKVPMEVIEAQTQQVFLGGRGLCTLLDVVFSPIVKNSENLVCLDQPLFTSLLIRAQAR